MVLVGHVCRLWKSLGLGILGEFLKLHPLSGSELFPFFHNQ